MKKVIFVLVLLFALAQVGTCASLKKDWNIDFAIFADDWFTFDDGTDIRTTADAHIDLESGTYGPFIYNHDLNKVTVAEDCEAAPSDSLIIPVSQHIGCIGDQGDFWVHFWANYDSSQMYIQVWYVTPDGENQLKYEQKQVAGINAQEGIYTSDFDYSKGSFYVKVCAVPEPSSLLALGTGIAGLGFLIKKKFSA